LADSPGFVAVEGGDSRVEIVPAQGGRIRSLHLFGREWLIGGDELAPAERRGDVMAGSGWDECAPAAGAGPLPDWVKGVGGRTNPGGGEARHQQPEVSVATESGAHRVTCIWRGENMPWVLTRTLLVRQDGAVEVRYEALTTGREKLPFLWSANILLPLASDTRVHLPEGARMRVASVKGTAPTWTTEKHGEATWPSLTLDARPRDLGNPWSVPRASLVNAWVDLGAGRSMLQIWQGEERLTLTCDGAGVPYCGLVIDRGGTETAGRRGMFGRAAKGRPAIALRPSLGAPDKYAEALGDWQAVTWLAPGEPRRWSMTLRGGS
jgi:galactose mutarotase-like enzyme